MSVNENYNISRIQNDLMSKIKTLNLTTNLYRSYRPAIKQGAGMGEIIVVRCSTDVNDLSAHGRIMTVIDIYAKDKGNLPDDSKISSFRDTITGVLPFSTDKYSFSYFTETPMSPDGNGYTFQIIKLTTIIKKF